MYIKRTWIYGNRKEVKKYHTARYGVKGEKRRKKEKPSPEKVKAVNERNARKKLLRLMINNFSQGDWHLTLTYAPDKRPDVEGSKKLLKAFFRKLRGEYRKQGAELKYIMVTEWKDKGLHHHLTINDIPGLSKLLTKLWGHGGIHLTPLYADGDYDGLAEYFVKETSRTFRNEDNPYSQRWTCSRNLVKPEEKVEVIKADSWREEPKTSRTEAIAGYVIDKGSLQAGVDAWGYPYQEYIMICYGSKDGKRKRERSGSRR